MISSMRSLNVIVMSSRTQQKRDAGNQIPLCLIVHQDIKLVFTLSTLFMTFRFALSVLEDEFDSIYRGIKTVREMCSSLTDCIAWEDESPDAIYHVFETHQGPNRVVKESQVIALAQFYSTKEVN